MDKRRDLRKVLGENVRNYRLERNVTQEYLAEKIGVTAVALSKIENGKSWPKNTTIERIAETLEIKPFQLFADTEADLAQYRLMMMEALSSALDKSFDGQGGRQAGFGLRRRDG